MNGVSDEMYLDLKGARERLCRAQVRLNTSAHREALGRAISEIDRVGVYWCPQWSRFDLPTVPEAGEVALDDGEAKGAASPGRRYSLEGGEGFYHVFVGTERVGLVVAASDRWTARLFERRERGSRWAWESPTRRAALAGLLRHLEIEP